MSQNAPLGVPLQNSLAKKLVLIIGVHGLHLGENE